MLSSVSKTIQRPKNTAYPKTLNSLGDHIRKKRLDLNLQQKDVAAILKVTTCSIWSWENNRSEPEIRYLPSIMNFLGYCPYDHKEYPLTYGKRIQLHRIYRGLSHRKLAKILGVDPCSLSRWEKRKYPPWKQYREKIERFMNS